MAPFGRNRNSQEITQDFRDSEAWLIMQNLGVARERKSDRQRQLDSGQEPGQQLEGPAPDLSEAYDNATSQLTEIAKIEEKLTNGTAAQGNTLIQDLITANVNLINQGSGDYASTARNQITQEGQLAISLTETANSVHENVYQEIADSRWVEMHAFLPTIMEDPGGGNYSMNRVDTLISGQQQMLSGQRWFTWRISQEKPQSKLSITWLPTVGGKGMPYWLCLRNQLLLLIVISLLLPMQKGRQLSQPRGSVGLPRG